MRIACDGLNSTYDSISWLTEGYGGFDLTVTEEVAASIIVRRVDDELLDRVVREHKASGLVRRSDAAGDGLVKRV